MDRYGGIALGDAQADSDLKAHHFDPEVTRKMFYP
jgi:hypothetical protein